MDINSFIKRLDEIKEIDANSADDIKTKLNIIKIMISEKFKSTDKELRTELEDTIQEIITSLRKTLRVILNKKSKEEKPSELEIFCYDLLVTLTALRPKNKYDPDTKKFIDPITLTTIEEDNKVLTTSGYMFDINSLSDYIKAKQKFISPIDLKEFSRLEQEKIKSLAGKKGITLLNNTNSSGNSLLNSSSPSVHIDPFLLADTISTQTTNPSSSISLLSADVDGDMFPNAVESQNSYQIIQQLFSPVENSISSISQQLHDLLDSDTEEESIEESEEESEENLEESLEDSEEESEENSEEFSQFQPLN